MTYTMAEALRRSFPGQSPVWYKLTITGFLILNPILILAAGPFVAGWVIVLQLVFSLAMAMKCYPLRPGSGFLGPDEVARVTIGQMCAVPMSRTEMRGI